MADPPTLQSFLSAARVSPDVFALRPDYRTLLIAASGIPPGPSNALSESMLQDAETTARDLLSKGSVLDIPHIAAWRDTFKAFGTKPKKYHCSGEALTRRVEAGLPRVNRLVDIYNGVSVKYSLPIGGENIDKMTGSASCIRATGAEKFEFNIRGRHVEESPEVGEVVWCDDEGVTCRRWNWRQCTRTALREDTTRVLFILDALSPLSDETLQAAADELIAALRGLSEEVKVEQRIIRAPGDDGQV